YRDLPWRRTKDPYRIWLSEIILQQTRVAQGLPYYHQFVKEFPNVKALATAPLQKVLREWQGLGCYSRARNLHACAKMVVKEFKGKFPETFDDLKSLPGIGSYTAAAISSMAFNQPNAVVDGNVFRVLSRVFGIEDDIASGNGKKVFELKAQELIDNDQPGIFNQALMEFGAMQCTPRSPACEDCIFSNGCFARKKSLQHLLPYKSKTVKVRNRYFTYFVLKKGTQLFMKKRNGKDIWTGLYDFYLIESNRPQTVGSLMAKDAMLHKLMKGAEVGEMEKIKHVLTHQRIDARFVTVKLPKSFSGDALSSHGLRAFAIGKIKSLPKPVLISRFLSKKGILE
ncbi:MAG: A/G-specific adenine glycosylase, partial [Cyclobacteriaceae bacterium]